MPYYNICPHCGSHLDPGERCDCKQEEDDEHEKEIALIERRVENEPTLQNNYGWQGYYPAIWKAGKPG